MKLTDNQREVLCNLASLRESPNQCSRRDGWATPMDFGGSDGSHHSGTAKRLADKGLVTREQYRGWGGGRGSCAYKITEAGIAALQAATGGAVGNG